MTLFLTSDENFTDGINSRTEFSNEIHQDFYKDGKFNLALKEIFFDATFPTKIVVSHNGDISQIPPGCEEMKI